jgi:hypothetical protein
LLAMRRMPHRPPVWFIGRGLDLFAAVCTAGGGAGRLHFLGGLAVTGLGTALVMPTANSEINRDAGEHQRH